MTIPDISLRKSLIPEVFLASPAGVFRGEKRAPLKTPAWEAKVFLDCYCVARKRPIRSEKTMWQTNICQLTQKYILYSGGQERVVFFFFLRIEADQPDSYNISRVLIREKW